MTPEITVIVATIPEREALLEQAIDTVQAQTSPVPYLVGVDAQHDGPVPTLNALAERVQTEWLFRLDDDDLLDPDHFQVLSKWLDDDADIVYTWCRVEGGGEEHPEAQFQDRFQAEWGWEYLRESNFIPASAAVRTSLWRDLGGLREPAWTKHEDWDFWVRALDAGARFRCVPTVTWTYRMNAEWAHRGAENDRRNDRRECGARP